MEKNKSKKFAIEIIDVAEVSPEDLQAIRETLLTTPKDIVKGLKLCKY